MLFDLLCKRSLVTPVLAAVLTFAHWQPVAAEDWTNLRGTHTVEAEMIGLWGDSVVLELSNGRRIAVKLSDLRSESRIQAQELAASINGARLGRVKELQGQAAEAAAPAPNPLPQPPPAPAYVAPTKGAKATDFLSQLDGAIENGHLIAIYDSLPPNFRQDVDDVAKLAAQKVSPATWQAIVGSLHQVGDLIVTRQKWFMSSPRIQMMPPEKADQIEVQGILLAGLLREGLRPEAMQLEQIQSGDFRSWLVDRDNAMAPYLAKLFQYSGSARTITVESEKGDTVVADVGEGNKVSFTNVDGFWVHSSLAEGWDDNIQSLKEEITAAPDGAYLDTYALMLGAFAPAIGPMAEAKDAGQFHEAMETVFPPMETIANSVAAMFGRSTRLASRGGGGGGYDEMMEGMDMEEDDMYADEMEMQMEMDERMMTE